LQALGTFLCTRGVGVDDAVERGALVAVPVEAADEVPAVLVAEGDGDGPEKTRALQLVAAA
jgi:hypothetical protein